MFREGRRQNSLYTREFLTIAERSECHFYDFCRRVCVHVIFSTVAVALWAMLPNVTTQPDLQLTLDAVYEGGVGNVQVNNPQWSPQGRS
jgi:hypothetical protein